MQVVSPSSPAPIFAGKERYSEMYGKLIDDFGSKLQVSSIKREEYRDDDIEKSWWNQNDKDDEEEEEEGEEEFSFASVNAENSPITADEAFEDGQIRPVYPLFNRNLLFDDDDSKEETLRSPLKKLFVETTAEEEEEEEDEETEPMGPYCSWKNRTVIKEASPGRTCRKSYSTGFSKLWRFKDLVLRSNSDGRDAFVFLSNNNGESGGDKKRSNSLLASSTAAEKGKEKTKTEKKMRTKSAHERLYMRNRAMREEGKRRSYLPYKHVGFFTNVHGLTKNVHPY